jgi:hypothetical protein
MNVSRKLLVAEAILFAVPLTALLGLFAPTISIPRKGEFWPYGAADLITVIAIVAVFAGWALTVKSIRGGGESLRHSHRAWWYAASFGVVLVLAAIVSMLLPASREYSPAAIFRDHLEHCILGLPLVIMLMHLRVEARGWSQRMSAGTSPL